MEAPYAGSAEPVTASPRPAWREAAALFRRPQPVTWAMVALFSIIPVYLANRLSQDPIGVGAGPAPAGGAAAAAAR